MFSNREYLAELDQPKENVLKNYLPADYHKARIIPTAAVAPQATSKKRKRAKRVSSSDETDSDCY